MTNFWQQTDKPLMALAPMEEVTDTVFREIVLSQTVPGNLHVVYTEFANTDGLCHPIGKEKVIHRLQVNPSERKLLKEKNVKLVAQIWGSKPEKYAETCKMICEEMDYDGIDINMGCPVPKIVKQGSCSKLITTPTLASEIIHACQENSNIPVSVKTRIGFKEVITEEWIGHLLDHNLPAVLIHGRTQSMMSEGLADWNEIAKGGILRDAKNKKTAIIGNGDVKSIAESEEKCETHNIDGVMIGRGIFHNPWLFTPEREEPTQAEKLQLLWDHASLFDKTWGDTKNFRQLRRFFKIYASNFKDAGVLRAALMESRDLAHVKDIFKEWGFSPIEKY
ncbi:MAG: tRNA-dihydrouridine synthase [Lentisphaeraceae bacterium]|nr:tRNA-dihydrouridine synthase [Lentisphaeraceae bacterium]